MSNEGVIDTAARWAALRTAARWEKAVAEKLAAVGIPVFLPLMTRCVKSKSKHCATQIPLFPGYVFCGETEYLDNKFLPTSCRRLVAQFLRTPDPDRLKNELRSVSELLADRQLVQERIYGVVGDTVRIVGGPLTGSSGQITQLKPGTFRVVLAVSFLGVRVEATVDERYLEKVQSSSAAML